MLVNFQHPKKTAVATAHAGGMFRLELNAELYEGVRFGWINVTSFVSEFTITAIRLVAQSKPTAYKGSFQSSQPMLDRIWYAAAFDVRANMESTGFGAILMDRGDRIAWTGDAHPSQACALVAFGDFEFVKNSTAASATHANGIATYSLYWAMSLFDYVRYTNDTAMLLEYSGNVDGKLMAAAEKIANNASHMGFCGWDERLGAGFENPNIAEVRRVYLSLAVRVATTFSSLLLEVGKQQPLSPNTTAMAAKWQQTATEWAAAISRDWQRQGWGMHALADAVNADAAMPTPFLSAADKAAIAASHFNDSVQICSFSPFNQYWVLQALGHLDQPKMALFSILHCWGGMLELGGTDFWEVYSPEWNRFLTANTTATPHVPDPVPNGQSGYTSLAHPWGAGVAAWMSENAVGLQPLTPGFGRWRVRSLLARFDLLTSVNGTVPTGRGTGGERVLTAAIRASRGWSSCTCSAPENTVGEIHLPKSEVAAGGGWTVTMDGVTVEAQSTAVDGAARMTWFETNTHVVVSRVRGEGRTKTRRLMLTSKARPGKSHGSPEAPTVMTNGVKATKESLVPPPHYAATVVGMDRTTGGAWRGKYGKSGFIMFNAAANKTAGDLQQLPPFVKSVDYGASATCPTCAKRMRPPRQGRFAVVGTAAAKAALQPPVGGGASPTELGFLATQNPIACDQTFPVDIVLQQESQQQRFRVAVYAADLDRGGAAGPRDMTVTAFDLATLDLVAPTQRVRHFEGGAWLVYTYDRSLRLRFSQIRGGDALVSGLFFDV